MDPPYYPMHGMPKEPWQKQVTSTVEREAPREEHSPVRIGANKAPISHDDVEALVPAVSHHGILGNKDCVGTMLKEEHQRNGTAPSQGQANPAP